MSSGVSAWPCASGPLGSPPEVRGAASLNTLFTGQRQKELEHPQQCHNPMVPHKTRNKKKAGSSPFYTCIFLLSTAGSHPRGVSESCSSINSQERDRDTWRSLQSTDFHRETHVRSTRSITEHAEVAKASETYHWTGGSACNTEKLWEVIPSFKFWGCKIQRGDHSSQHCIIYLKVAKSS